jgi:hypothetical protein
MTKDQANIMSATKERELHNMGRAFTGAESVKNAQLQRRGVRQYYDVDGRWLRLLLVFGCCAYFQWQVMRDGRNTLARIGEEQPHQQPHQEWNSMMAKEAALAALPIIKPAQPLWFGMGQGTTGTHSMYDATCRLNVTSVHGNAVCVDVQTHDELQPKQIDGIQAHFYALSNYKNLRRCAEDGMNCTLDQAVRYMTNMKDMIREVILSDVNGVHDTPYSFMTSYVIQTAMELRQHPPLLITSERDPVKWSSRRAESHSKSIVCRYYFTFDRDYSHLSKYDAFDVNHCMDMALQQQQASSTGTGGITTTPQPAPVMYNEVFASYRKLIAEADGNATKLDQITEFNRRAIDHYQSLVRVPMRIMRDQQKSPALVYKIDMFEREGGVVVSELEIATELQKKVQTSPHVLDRTRDALIAEQVHIREHKILNRSHAGMPHRFIKKIVKVMTGERSQFYSK